MKKIKTLVKEPSFMRSSLFIIFNAFLLYVLYFIIKNFNNVFDACTGAVGSILAALSPLFIGLIIAYLLNPLVTKIDTRLLRKALANDIEDNIKRKKREKVCRMLSILLTFIIVLACIAAIIYGFTAMILGQFVFSDILTTAETLIQQALNYEAEMQEWVARTFPEGFLGEKVMQLANIIVIWVTDNFSASATIATVAGAVGSIINFVIGVIISIYLLNDKEFFIRLWNRLIVLIIPRRASTVLNSTLHEVNGVLSLFIRGALLDAVFVAILSSIGLSLLHIEFAVFIGVFAGIANVIPYFGPVLGMIPAFIMGWLTGDFLHGILAVVVLLAVQQIDSNIIYPKVVGSSTGLHPLAVLLAVSVFGYFGGILGMLLAVPTTGVIQIFVKKWVHKREADILASGEASTEETDNEEATGAEDIE